jgi:hypothetical protein
MRCAASHRSAPPGPRTPGMDTRPTTLIWLSSGVMASFTARVSRSCVASDRLAPSASSRSTWSRPGGVRGQGSEGRPGGLVQQRCGAHATWPCLRSTHGLLSSVARRHTPATSITAPHLRSAPQ